MKVAFVIPAVQPSCGIGAVVEHARGLREDHGFDASLVLNRDGPAPSATHGLESVRVLPLQKAQQLEYDIVVATAWETAYALFTLRSARFACFVQSLEDRFFPPERAAERFGAALTHGLPVAFITQARAIADTLRALRPDASCYLVRDGVDKDVFALPDYADVRLEGPLRILAEGRPSVWFEGVREAVAAVSRMEAPHYLTVVTSDPPGLPAHGYERVLGPLPQRELARRYHETDVLLRLPRVEAASGPPLEAFHCGATCVATPASGHDEWMEHGWNGLVVDWDDERGTARLLDLLARDRRLLHFLRTNALATARSWPSWSHSTQFMAAALETIRARPGAWSQAAGLRIVSDFRVGVELSRLGRDPLPYADANLSWAPHAFHTLVAKRWVRILARPARPLYRRLRTRLVRRIAESSYTR